MIGAAAISMVEIVAGLGWDPEIRGLLTVALALAVLGGSVWLLLVTNTGTRLGSLIALAGFFGWMFVMGIFWWIYGIGWAGSLPTWEVQDVFIDAPGAEVEGLQEAFVGNVDDLPDGNCFNQTDHFPPEGGVASVSLDQNANTWALCSPRAIDLVMAYPEADRNAITQQLLNPQTDEAKIPALASAMFGVQNDDTVVLLASLSSAQRDELFDAQVAARTNEVVETAEAANARLGSDDPRFLSRADLDAKIEEDLANAMLRIDDINLSQLEALAPQCRKFWSSLAALARPVAPIPDLRCRDRLQPLNASCLLRPAPRTPIAGSRVPAAKRGAPWRRRSRGCVTVGSTVDSRFCPLVHRQKSRKSLSHEI